MSDRLLTVREAAARLACPVSTVYALSYERKIAVVKLGRSLRIRESEIEKLIRRNERPALREGLDG